jgi:hypothetical protein
LGLFALVSWFVTELRLFTIAVTKYFRLHFTLVPGSVDFISLVVRDQTVPASKFWATFWTKSQNTTAESSIIFCGASMACFGFGSPG